MTGGGSVRNMVWRWWWWGRVFPRCVASRQQVCGHWGWVRRPQQPNADDGYLLSKKTRRKLIKMVKQSCLKRIMAVVVVGGVFPSCVGSRQHACGHWGCVRGSQQPHTDNEQLLSKKRHTRSTVTGGSVRNKSLPSVSLPNERLV